MPSLMLLLMWVLVEVILEGLRVELVVGIRGQGHTPDRVLGGTWVEAARLTF